MKNRIIVFIIIWILITASLGYFDVFLKLPIQAFGSYVFIINILIVISYLKIKNLRSLINSIPLKLFAFINIFRIFAGLLFLHFSDKLPEEFVYKAGYGDIVAGLLGASVFIFGHRKITYYLLNIFGLLDLVNALSIGMFLNITGNPKMEFAAQFPILFIPLLIVTHINSLTRLPKIMETTLFELIQK
ncbi:MAG: hypothetical protein A3F91_11745 [Flavobacteria bacterium RIFCSPLOWO2_12_FULL_35_11]|nr:MAG: hypothetical protein A3F91_11745 [Flavobacteria bacterium RIFCSPLOWO2_12_FULL_35_11]